MKLQSKFTFAFVIFSVLLVGIYYILMSWNIRVSFENFSREKNSRQAEVATGANGFQNKPKEITKEQSSYLRFIFKDFPKDSPEYRFLSDTKGTLLSITIIGLLLSLILGYIFSAFLIKKILFLNNSINTYNGNGIAISLQSNGTDEISELIRSYNSLIKKIEHQEFIRKEFFIDMAHEIRTPLTAIKGYLEGLLDKIYDPKDEIFNKALNEANRLVRLTKVMSSLAKLEANTSVLHRDSVDLRALIEEMRDALGPQLEEKGLSIEISGQLIELLDREKFTQVFTNLLSNAISYAPQNTIITFALTEKTKTITVGNIAENVTQKDIPFLFERFYRSDKSRAFDENNQHLGIGLSIVQRIVLDHGGAIRVFLENGKIFFEITL